MKIICITPIKHIEGLYDKLKSYGEIIYEPHITKEQLKTLLKNSDAEYLLVGANKQNFILGEDVLKLSNIKVINTISTGTNHIDSDYCKSNNIQIWSLKKDYELIEDIPSTSELAFGLMMSLMRNIPKSFHSVRDGNWDWEPFLGNEIKGKTIGVVGYGRLGKIMCKLFDGWGVKLLATDPYERITTARGVPLDELLKKSDVVFLHIHVTNETRDMVDSEFLSKMKRGSYLINTSRGELVDEDAIIESIQNGHLNGYGTDVIKDEFDDIQSSKLVEFSINPNNNVIITPHVGGMTIEAQKKSYNWTIEKFSNE